MHCCTTRSGTARCYALIPETLQGVTEALRIINTVYEYLRNIDTGGPRYARGACERHANADDRLRMHACACMIYKVARGSEG